MMKDERKEQKRKEAFRKWARQHAKLRRNLRKHGGDILQSGNFSRSDTLFLGQAFRLGFLRNRYASSFFADPLGNVARAGCNGDAERSDADRFQEAPRLVV